MIKVLSERRENTETLGSYTTKVEDDRCDFQRLRAFNLP